MKKTVSIIYTSRADKDFDHLEKALVTRIMRKIRANCDKCTHPLDRAKALSGPFLGSHRYRIGEYRAVFDFTERGELQILSVYSVKHRRDVYR